jgi:hypothetical protein
MEPGSGRVSPQPKERRITRNLSPGAAGFHSITKSRRATSLRLRRLFFSTPRRRIRFQRTKQTRRSAGHLLNRRQKSRLVRLRWLVASADLSHILQRSSADLLIRHRRLEVEKHLDIAAHISAPRYMSYSRRRSSASPPMRPSEITPLPLKTYHQNRGHSRLAKNRTAAICGIPAGWQDIARLSEGTLPSPQTHPNLDLRIHGYPHRTTGISSFIESERAISSPAGRVHSNGAQNLSRRLGGRAIKG